MNPQPQMRLQTAHRDVITVSRTIAEQADQFARSVHDLIDEQAELELNHENRPAQRRTLPHELAELLAHVVEAVANGGTVTISRMPKELTTTAAAGMLGISRPTLMKMIKHGEIEAHKVGTHTRLRTDEVLRFKEAQLVKRREAFEELRLLEDDLGL